MPGIGLTTTDFWTSRSSRLIVGAWVAELDPGVAGGDLQVDLTLGGVGGGLPGGRFGVEHGRVVDAPVHALPGQRGQFDLGDGEPGPVWGGDGSLAAGPARTRWPGRTPHRARRWRGC